MTMRTDDMHEIIRGTVDHLRVRLEHRSVSLSEDQVEQLVEFLDDLLRLSVDNSADTGGDWDNA